MGFIRSGLVFLILVIMGSPVLAEIYQPGTGILLPSKRQSRDEKPKIQKNSNNSGPAVIKNGQVIVQPQSQIQPQNPVIIGKPQNNQDADKNAQLTAAYATHLFTSICAQEYREALAPKSEKNLDMKKMWSDVQASCKCLSTQVLSVVPASDFADYVMFNHGAQNFSKPDPELAAYLKTGRSNQISDLVQNGELRKKCGFLK